MVLKNVNFENISRYCEFSDNINVYLDNIRIKNYSHSNRAVFLLEENTNV